MPTLGISNVVFTNLSDQGFTIHYQLSEPGYYVSSTEVYNIINLNGFINVILKVKTRQATIPTQRDTYECTFNIVKPSSPTRYFLLTESSDPSKITGTQINDPRV